MTIFTNVDFDPDSFVSKNKTLKFSEGDDDINDRIIAEDLWEAIKVIEVNKNGDKSRYLDPIIDFNDGTSNRSCIKFEPDNNGKQRFYKMLKDSTKKLVKTLVEYIVQRLNDFKDQDEKLRKEGSDNNKIAKPHKKKKKKEQGKGFLDFRVQIFKEYRGPLYDEVIDNETKCLQARFLNGQLGDIKDSERLTEEAQKFRKVFFKEFIRRQQKEFENYTEEHEKEDLEALKTLKVLTPNCKFKRKPGKKYPKLPDIDGIKDLDVDEFLEALVIAAKQPDDKKLEKRLNREFKTKLNLSSKLPYSSLHKVMIDWLKDKEGKYLSNISNKSIFESLTRDLSHILLIGSSTNLYDELRNSTLNFVKFQELDKFLNKDCDKQVLLYEAPKTLRLTTIRFYKNISKRKKFETEGSCIFLSLKASLSPNSPMKSAFETRSLKLLVIECDIEVEEGKLKTLFDCL